MKIFSLILMGSFTGLFLSSCGPTTGDPREGGLFGWNRDQAEWRLQDRRDAANEINEDTRRIDAENRRLRQTRDNLR